MLDKYSGLQSSFYNYFMSSFTNNRISHAYLIETNNVFYGFDLAVDLAKFLLCNGEFDSKICELIDSNNYPNFKIIGSSNDVKKGEIVSLKSTFSMKSFDGNKQVYIIKDASIMNKSASNSLLKFLEEPDGDVIAILLCNSISSVLPTIVSRCQVVRLLNNDNCYSNIFKSLYESSETSNNFEDFCFEYGSKFFEVYKFFESDGCFVITSDVFYDLGGCYREFLLFGLYLYFDVLCASLSIDKRYLPNCFVIDDFISKNSVSEVIRKIDIVNNFLYNSKYNVNVNLFLDNFIICLDGR